jgi:hypothetical protein
VGAGGAGAGAESGSESGVGVEAGAGGLTGVPEPSTCGQPLIINRAVIIKRPKAVEKTFFFIFFLLLLILKYKGHLILKPYIKGLSRN